jgi:hypothetical protein
MARAEGPRASSENNWPGIGNADPGIGIADTASPFAPAAAPQYVWQEGYDHGGKWHGHWVLIH